MDKFEDAAPIGEGEALHEEMFGPEPPVQGWVDCHSHQFGEVAGMNAKPIEVDDKSYMPGVYESGYQHEDWASMYRELGGEA